MDDFGKLRRRLQSGEPSFGYILTTPSVAAFPALLNVGGVDLVSVSRGDLAASLGHIGEVNQPDVREQVNVVEELVREAGRALGEAAHNKDGGYVLCAARLSPPLYGEPTRATRLRGY